MQQILGGITQQACLVKWKKVPSWKRSLSTRSRTVGDGITIEDFKLSEPGFSTARK